MTVRQDMAFRQGVIIFSKSITSNLEYEQVKMYFGHSSYWFVDPLAHIYT